jgi:radical SAM protein with 4Fe4S-binding SPASM domain
MSEIAPTAPPRLKQEDRKGRPVIAYLKPSDYCNVGCDHCYLPAAVRANKTRMEDDVLDKAILTVREMVDRQKAPGAVIVWHGGEPLALPIDYLNNACLRVTEVMPSAIQSIQTSLIPYRTAWAEVIHEHFDGSIGSSIDFSQRTLKGSSDRYLDFWLEKVASARADGCHIIPGTVPSTGEMGRGSDIVDWMADNDFNSWNIDRYNSFGKDDPARPLNKAHSTFLTEVYTRIMEHAEQGRFYKVNTVTAAIGGVLRNDPGDRWGGSCSRDFIVVNPDGSTSACPDKISFETLSNIKDGYDGFVESDARKAWIRMHMTGHRNEHCPTCKFNTFCRSGCPLTPNAPESEGECSGYHRHLSYVSEHIKANPQAIRSYLKGIESYE